MKHFYYSITAFLFVFLCYSDANAQGEPARLEANINQVYTEYGLTGDGVVMVIIDRGINYFHPDFIDENGETRLLYLYDMLNSAGSNDPDNPYGIGTIFNEDEINASLETDGPPLSDDRYGHGTATAGIAGGNGSGTQSGEFHGVAHKARYIIIKATHDYFPPFDGQAGQDGFYDPNYITVALQFAADKINDLDMPSVTLLNMGSIGGPTDGTSTIARAIDEFVDMGNPFVCGVGDDGGNYNHASTTVSQGETIDLVIEKNVAGNLRFDLWYDEADRFEVSITRPDNTVEGPFPAPISSASSDDRFLTGINYYHRGANTDFYGATSNRRELLIDFTSGTGEFKVTIKATEVGGSGSFHATLNPSTFSNDNKFTSYQVWGTSINDFASATKAIVPTDYIVKNNWVDMDGIPREITGQGVQGGIWAGSSIGPTQDDRMGVDFAAPGEVLYAAYSPNTYYSSNEWLLVEGGDNNYGIQNAVSAAAPLTMGVIALMLEFRPNLTPVELETALQNSARKDSYTDTIANRVWGHGKLDAYEAVKTVDGLGIFNNNQAIKHLIIYPNPGNGQVQIDLNDTGDSKIEKILFFNQMGQQVLTVSGIAGTKQALNVEQLPDGIYQVIAKSKNIVYTSKFIKQ